MSRKIKVKKSLGKVKTLEKIERNENVANQIPLHPQLVTPPHIKTDYLVVTSDCRSNYTKHLTGNHEATLLMYENEKTLDEFYYDTAEYVEVIANATDDTTLPISMGFEKYADKAPRAPKTITIRDGNHPGEIFVEYPKLEGAAAYRADIAEVVAGQDPVWSHRGACSITFMIIDDLKPNTKYLIRLNGIFASGEGPASAPVSFRTKEWE